MSTIRLLTAASGKAGEQTLPLDELATELEGVQSLVNRLMGLGDKLTPEQFVDGCLDLNAPVVLFPDTMGQ